MKCPQCVIDHETSRCFSNNRITTTVVSGSEYWDEAGVFHRHDPNSVISSYHCSRGHCWTVKSRRRCPACTYGHSDPVTRIINPTL